MAAPATSHPASIIALFCATAMLMYAIKKLSAEVTSVDGSIMHNRIATVCAEIRARLGTIH